MIKRFLVSIILCALCAFVVYPEDKAGPPADRIKDLIKQLGNDDWQTRENAQKALEEIGEPAEAALTEATKSPDPEVRHRALVILNPLIMKKRVKFSDGLLQSFPNIYNDLAASDTAGKFKLLQKVTARNEHNGYHYKYNITNQDIANLVGEVLLEGGKGLTTDDKKAIMEIVTQDTPIPEAAPHIMKLLTDDASRIRNEAIETLGKLGAREAIPEIRKLLDSHDKATIANAVSALGILGDKESIPFIMDLLSDLTENSIKAAAAGAVGKLGIKKAVPQLIKLLGDENSNVCMSAARALGDLEATEAIPELMKIYKGADYSRQYSIGEAIAKLVTKETLPQIMKLAKEAGIAKNITYSLSRGINQLGIEKALPELIPLLKDEDEDTRWTANKALGSLISIKGIPELVKLLKHENAEVRGFVAIELVELCQKDRIPKEVIEDIKLIEKWGGSYESRARSVLKELGAEEKNK